MQMLASLKIAWSRRRRSGIPACSQQISYALSLSIWTCVGGLYGMCSSFVRRCLRLQEVNWRHNSLNTYRLACTQPHSEISWQKTSKSSLLEYHRLISRRSCAKIGTALMETDVTMPTASTSCKRSFAKGGRKALVGLTKRAFLHTATRWIW